MYMFRIIIWPYGVNVVLYDFKELCSQNNFPKCATVKFDRYESKIKVTCQFIMF